MRDSLVNAKITLHAIRGIIACIWLPQCREPQVSGDLGAKALGNELHVSRPPAGNLVLPRQPVQASRAARRQPEADGGVIFCERRRLRGEDSCGSCPESDVAFTGSRRSGASAHSPGEDFLWGRE